MSGMAENGRLWRRLIVMDSGVIDLCCGAVGLEDMDGDKCGHADVGQCGRAGQRLRRMVRRW
jgi:hypothetical protein